MLLTDALHCGAKGYVSKLHLGDDTVSSALGDVVASISDKNYHSLNGVMHSVYRYKSTLTR